MNVSSECVDNFHWLSFLAVLLQSVGTVTTNSGMHSYVMFIYFGKNVVPIGHGNSFRLVLERHGKVMENDFPKRVVTLTKDDRDEFIISLSVWGLAIGR